MFAKLFSLFSKRVNDTLLYHSGNPYPAIGSYWYNDRACWKPVGIYKITRLEDDKMYSGGKNVYGKMVLPVILAQCNGLKVVELLNNPHCSCDPTHGVEEQHEEPFGPYWKEIKKRMVK